MNRTDIIRDRAEYAAEMIGAFVYDHDCTLEEAYEGWIDAIKPSYELAWHVAFVLKLPRRLAMQTADEIIKACTSQEFESPDQIESFLKSAIGKSSELLERVTEKKLEVTENE